MALKLLICLLFVAGVFPDIAISTGETPASTSSSSNATASTTASTTAATTASTTASTITATTANTTLTNATTTKPTSSSSPPTPPGVCASNPCGSGSTCQERANGEYECLCRAGDYYDGKQCVEAKVFPGTLTLTGTYVEAMADPTSVEFKETADGIVTKLNDKFKTDTSYLGSTVTKLSPASTRTGILATVETKFDIDSKMTSTIVKESVNEIIGYTFHAISLCEVNACDETTANCTDDGGLFTCTCKAGYLPTALSDRLCVACPSGQKAVDGKCKPCPFGYTGFMCGDNWKLILVIVGSVLGSLLLVAIILLPVLTMKKNKKSKKGKENEKSYVNPAPMKTPYVSNGTAVPRPTPVQATPASGRPGFGGNAVPRIPRATTNESWDRSNLEMAPSNSRQNLIPAGRNSRRFDDDDDSNPYSRPMKPQSNPYAIGRPQVNPYASGQGHSNPYYRNDDGKRY